MYDENSQTMLWLNVQQFSLNVDTRSFDLSNFLFLIFETKND